MWKNYFKIAFRTLVRQKGYSVLNVTGLAVGLACAFLIALWIRDEVSYDRFHENADRLYRVLRHVHSGDEIQTTDLVTWPLARVLEEQYPEVEDVAATLPQDFVLRRGGTTAREHGLFADPDFFEMFSWHLLQGEPGALLQDPSSIVISTSLAQKYFGSGWRTRAVGGTIQNTAGLPDFTVTGVFEDVPRTSSVSFDFVLPMKTFIRYNDWARDWMNSGFRLYVRLREGAEEADGAALSEQIVDLQNDHIDGFRSDLFLQPYADQHLYGRFTERAPAGGRIAYVRMFALVAFMVVLIACINFMNLATAYSTHRAREIGVRKAVGAGRRSLVGQFMGESLLLVGLAFVLALWLAASALPVFNNLTGKAVPTAALGGTMLLLFGGIGVLTALIAGLYPAFHLSSFSAAGILRGTFRLGSGGARLRRGLVVFQFAMTILLIVGTVTVYQQIRYIYAKYLGLDRENVVSLPLEGGLREQFGAAKEELLFVRTAPGRTREALASLEAVHDRFNPGSPFAYEFLDESYAAMYRSLSHRAGSARIRGRRHHRAHDSGADGEHAGAAGGAGEPGRCAARRMISMSNGSFFISNDSFLITHYSS